MPSPAVTYSFSNGTTADATQVNQNFTDLIAGLTDGTKSLVIDALTSNGAAIFNGAVTLGNGAADDITVTGSLASSVPIKTNNSFDIGSSALGLAGVYLGSAGGLTTRVKGGATGSSWTLTLPVDDGTADQVLKTDGSGVTSWRTLTTPTVQKFTSGSGTYTTPANVKYIRVRMVGAGGGGAGSGTTTPTGGTGGNTTFGSSLLVANGGVGGSGSLGGVGGTGGTASLGTGPVGLALTGGGGCAGGYIANLQASAGAGGASAFGGAGAPTQTTGGAGATNTGGGGSGARCDTNDELSGAGGGSGGFVDALIVAPDATYAYAVGAAGTAGTAGTSGHAGGAGGSGLIIVEEYYQ